MLEGRIVKGVGGFYYVKNDLGLTECRPRGVFRIQGIVPMVGDIVRYSQVKGDKLQGIIEEILPRKTVLFKPMVANVQQCIVVMSVDRPKPDLLFTDRLIVLASISGLETVICINKTDLDTDNSYKDIAKVYMSAGYPVVCTSTRSRQGISNLIGLIKDRISVFSGPSGVGKSSLLNSIQPDLKLKTGDISEKLKRGKHTTRHAELLELAFGGMVVDTPGFSSIKLSSVTIQRAEDINMQSCFPEFEGYREQCKFIGCRHNKEPECGVKEAVIRGDITGWRYQNYLSLMAELEDNRRSRYD
jgi:ribosome biogenesis GTPase